jgi:hypothetical protein
MKLPATLLPLLAVIVACTHAPAPPPAQFASAASPQPSAATPELLAIRVLTVAWKGAHRAPETVQRDKIEALERARMFSQMARQGDKLSEMVGSYSDRPGAFEDRGLTQLKPAEPQPWNEAVVRAAVALPVGGISEPVETNEGYVVLERMVDPPAGPAQIRARHILITHVGSEREIPGATRSEAEARALATQLAQRAREAGADFSALAVEFTEEPSGKERSGDLGQFGRGQMVPAFEKTAFALKVGEVSDVVQSPFGFHVIQRYE